MSVLEERFIELTYLFAMQGKPFPLVESAGCSKWVLDLVESEYNFVTLQYKAINLLASKLNKDPDAIANSIGEVGFTDARDWIKTKFPSCRKPNFFDIKDEGLAVSEMASFFEQYL